MGLKFGDGEIFGNIIRFNNQDIKYDEIKYFRFKNSETIVNAISLYIAFEIILWTTHGKKRLYEKADSRPALLRIPISHLFNSEKRKRSKRKILEEQTKILISFQTIIKKLQENTGMEGNDLSSIQEQYL